jgi:hypothetical protein
MQRSHIIILLAFGLAALQAVQLVTALRAGRARSRTGTIYAVLLLCAGLILWALLSPVGAPSLPRAGADLL